MAKTAKSNTENGFDLMFILTKETKGALVYKQVDSSGDFQASPVGTIYLRKDALEGRRPKGLRVDIKELSA